VSGEDDGKQPLRVVLDDTLNPHKGPHIFGLECHVDPVFSSRHHKILRFGLCWVVLSVVVRVPFSKRIWALPVLFRLYQAKKSCPADACQKKTDLARTLLDVLCAAFPDVSIHGGAGAQSCRRKTGSC